MHCPDCSHELAVQNYKGFRIQTCPSCKGMFILQEELQMLETKEDPSVGWLDLELWKHHSKYETTRGSVGCPSCAGHFHTLSYPHSDVQLAVCHECRAVWLNEKMLDKLHKYLDQKISNESVGDYLKDFGHEIVEVLQGHEKPQNLGIIFKLLQYRVFAQIPFIKNLIQNLPKV
jgi:Zn-finger nucleic acid-binding protein